jgi:hypothetical protein
MSDDELDALLAQRNPVAHTDLDSDSSARVLSEVRVQTLAHTELSSAAGWPAPRPSRRWGRRRFLGGGVAVAVIAVVVALVGIGGAGSNNDVPGWLPKVTAAQAATLDRIAAAAAQQSGPGRGQWLFQRYQIYAGGGGGYGKTMVNYHDSYREQQWTNPDDVSRVRDVYTSFAFDTPKDRANYYGPDHAQLASALADGPAPGRHTTDGANPSLGSRPGDPRNMPDTTVGILNRFKQNFRNEVLQAPRKGRASYEQQFGDELFDELALILSNSTSETQRAAALKAIAYVGGVKVLGTRRDVLGRSGLAVQYVWNHSSGSKTTLIFDPTTGNLLEQINAALRPLAGAPTADFYVRTVYLQRAIVGSMTSLPGGGTQPFHGALPQAMKKIIRITPTSAAQTRRAK